ncbi:hypothetical protein H2509_03355 [Stappia sp. F7233]|uniref:Uncharacterized protein n=1 Tax=Stappia albiluteola TaxID=2758565 RepID=A0A839AAE2_9HYPH|nr:hypothetical protein [Stappia albiluteola]MBA5776156.1 hypothetical protein [Stappia albiluteola]
MPKFPNTLVAALALASFTLGVPAIAYADCSEDIDKVEKAVEQASESGMDQSTADSVRQLLDRAVEQRSAGDEAQCQELINQAKAMANVE